MRHFLFLLLIIPMLAQAGGGGDPVIRANSSYLEDLQEQRAAVIQQIDDVEAGRYDTTPTVLFEHSTECSSLRERYVAYKRVAIRAGTAIEAVPVIGVDLELTREYIADLTMTQERHMTMAARAERDILALPLVEHPVPPDIVELRATLVQLDGELHRMGTDPRGDRMAIASSFITPRLRERTRIAILASNPVINVPIPDSFPSCGGSSS